MTEDFVIYKNDMNDMTSWMVKGRESFNDAGEWPLCVHDVVEHQPHHRGTLLDEFEAIGAWLVTRQQTVEGLVAFIRGWLPTVAHQASQLERNNTLPQLRMLQVGLESDWFDNNLGLISKHINIGCKWAEDRYNKWDKGIANVSHGITARVHNRAWMEHSNLCTKEIRIRMGEDNFDVDVVNDKPKLSVENLRYYRRYRNT